MASCSNGEFLLQWALFRAFTISGKKRDSIILWILAPNGASQTRGPGSFENKTDTAI